MMIVFANNASSRLYAAIDAITTSIRVQAGDGAKFPHPAAGEYFTVTIEDRRTGQVEICNCTANLTDILTVVRGQEGTAAQAFAYDATVSNRLTAATMDFLAHAGGVGPQGPIGPAGPIGPVGPSGPQGIPGDTGAKGDQGPQGTTGAPGNDGADGAPGATGPQGATGAQGPTGPQGDTGATGAPSTVPGPPGATGPQGPTGAKGADSTVPGPQGPKGDTGATGLQGPPGVKGDKGDTGATGAAGSSDWGAITNKPATFPPSAHIHPQSEITNLVADLALKAPIDAPLFTGNARSTTPPAADNDTSIATTAFVKAAIASGGLFKRPYSYSGEAGEIPSSVGKLTTNAAGSAATVLSIYSVPTDNSSNIGTLMESTIKPGSLIVLQKPGDLTTYTIYEVTGAPVGQSGNIYYNIPIKWVMSYGALYPVMAVDFIFALGGGGGASTSIGSAAPASPLAGQMWWDSDSGRLYIYYNDGNTSQWVEAVTSPVDLTNFVTEAELDARVKWVPGGVQLLDQTGFAVMGSTTNYTQFFSDWFDVYPRPDTLGVNAGYHIRDKVGNRRARILADTVGATGQITIQSFTSANVGDATFVIAPGGFSTSASLTVTGNVTASGHVFSSWGFVASGNTVALAPTTSGEILLRPGGSGSILGEVKIDNTSNIHATMNNLTGTFALWAKDSAGVTRGNFVVPMNAATGMAYIRCMNNAGSYDNALTMVGNPSTASRMLTLSGAGAEKTTAGSWTAACDARIKEVHGNYEPGLPEILQLQPKRFHYLGNDFTEDPTKLVKMGEDDEGQMPQSLHHNMEDHEVVGMIAQEIETVLPDTVKLSKGWIDGKQVSDLRQFDPTNLTYALINAVKELTAIVQEQAARIAALEAANGGV
jgi:hypothetical protein